MHQKTIDKYTVILDDYLIDITEGMTDSYRTNIVNYFFPPLKDNNTEDTKYFIYQFEKVLRIKEEEEKYEECATVVKIINKLKKMKSHEMTLVV